MKSKVRVSGCSVGRGVRVLRQEARTVARDRLSGEHKIPEVKTQCATCSSATVPKLSAGVGQAAEGQGD